MKPLKSLLLSGLSILVLSTLNAQIISQFDFDANPVTDATVGPDAINVSGSATSSPGGTGGTNGLNAGSPKANINMIIPGSPTFDVAGIDVSFDFHREESQGNFFERGQSLRILGTNNLSVIYRVDDGAGGYNQINSGNVYGIPNDDTYRRYRFVYTPCDGIGMLIVDNTVVWSNDGPDNRDLYWGGAGNVVVGGMMDGTGNQDTFFDNLVVGEVACSPLPVEFLNISATPVKEDFAQIDWTTASERNNSHFVVEKMISNNEWDEIGKVAGAGFSVETLNYSFIDKNPVAGLSYYRVRQVDFDENYSFSDITSLKYNTEELKVYPNPSEGLFNIFWDENLVGENSQIEIFNLQGKLVRSFDLGNDSKNSIDLTDVDSGCYILKLGEQTRRIVVN